MHLKRHICNCPYFRHHSRLKWHYFTHSHILWNLEWVTGLAMGLGAVESAPIRLELGLVIFWSVIFSVPADSPTTEWLLFLPLKLVKYGRCAHDLGHSSTFSFEETHHRRGKETKNGLLFYFHLTFLAGTNTEIGHKHSRSNFSGLGVYTVNTGAT